MHTKHHGQFAWGVELTLLKLAIESLPSTLCVHVTVSLELNQANGTRIILTLF